MKNLFNRPLILKNPVQEYAWGSHTAIQDLLGSPPTDLPWAELWLGAHPKAASLVDFMDEWISLDSLIEKFPAEILGRPFAEKFKNSLPYLFKILAAERPLSIQAHPNLLQAKQGFDRENQEKIPLNSPIRNYKDDRHKPECICALTRFTALKGFRDLQSIKNMLGILSPVGFSDELKRIEINQNESLKVFFKSLMTLPDSKKHLVISEAIENAGKHADEAGAFAWVIKLHRQYPDDIGIFSPVLLNLVQLEPGQALFIDSGELHSYLDGVGIELMANSDNVIRGGLTPKYVDVSELLNVLSFKETKIDILLPVTIGVGEVGFPLPVDEFSLSMITVTPDITYVGPSNRSAEILLCTRGSGHLIFSKEDAKIFMKKGSSVLIPAALEGYGILGDATFYKAGVPV